MKLEPMVLVLPGVHLGPDSHGHFLGVWMSRGRGGVGLCR